MRKNSEKPKGPDIFLVTHGFASDSGTQRKVCSSVFGPNIFHYESNASGLDIGIALRLIGQFILNVGFSLQDTHAFLLLSFELRMLSERKAIRSVC
jgi:hypothetical protein